MKNGTMLSSMLRNALIMVAAMALASGCQSSSSTPPRARSNASNNQALTEDQAFNTDPSAMRLDDIEGALLLYYRDNQTMPPHLSDLDPYAKAVGITLVPISPTNGQPYGYDPNGMTAVGATKLLVVYDPAPSPNGRRWCIVMEPPRPGAALSAEVLDLPEFVFRSYLAGAR